MIEIIAKAGYEVRKTERYGVKALHSWFRKVSHGKIKPVEEAVPMSIL